MGDDGYDAIIKKIKDSSFLALPQSVVHILELSEDPSNGPPEYAVPICADPGLTTQVLRFINSSFFGFRYKITTVQVALSLVSVQTIKNFVLWNAIVSLVPNHKCGPFSFRAFNQDSLRRGAFTKCFSSLIPGLDSESLFVNGMLQDIAILPLAQCWPNEYEMLLQRSAQTGKRLSELEESHFGWNHARAGALLVKEWGFGDDFAKTIENHIIPPMMIKPNANNVQESIVSLSSLLPSVTETEWRDADAFFVLFNKFFQKRTPPSPYDIFEATDALHSDLLGVSQLEPIPFTMIDFHKKYLDSFNS